MRKTRRTMFDKNQMAKEQQGKRKMTKTQMNRLWKELIRRIGHQMNTNIVKEMKAEGPLLIKQIYLMSTSIGAEGLSLLVRVNCPLLDFLRIASCNLDAPAARVLSTGKWPKLSQLDLQFNRIGNRGLKHLIDFGQFPNLAEFSVHSNNIREEGIKYIYKANWPKVRCLILNKNQINDAGALSLTKFLNFPTLTNLYLSGPFNYFQSKQMKKMLPQKCYFDLY